MTDPQTVVYEGQGEIRSFLQRLPWFFAVPFQWDVVLSLILLWLWTTLPVLIFSTTPLPLHSFFLSGLAWIFWLGVLLRAYILMEAMSQGRLTAHGRRAFRLDIERRYKEKRYKVPALLLIWSTWITVVPDINTTRLGQIVFAFVSIGLPASVMVLSISNSLQRALNPARWVSIMVHMGKPYVVLLVVPFLLVVMA